MIERKIPKELNNKGVVNAIYKLCPNIPGSVIHKAFRKREVKNNGVRISKDSIVSEGDVLRVFGVDEMTKEKQADLIVYEDQNLVIVNKPQGMPVHPGRTYTGEATLIDRLQVHLDEKLYLCHRLDRNTGGLMMVARNKPFLDEILKRMSNRQIVKEYTATVIGDMEPGHYTENAWLEKNSKINQVFIKPFQTENSFNIETSYTVMEKYKIKDTTVTKIKVIPITGRTHQIRAHLAYMGYPVLGDGKYGDNDINKRLRISRQQLFSTLLVFQYNKDASLTGYLAGRRFEME